MEPLPWDARRLAATIDHTLLAPEASPAAIERLCDEAVEHGFATVCVNGVHVGRCAERLRGTPVSVCSVVGFPLGANAPRVKQGEALLAIDEGAKELDMVLQVGALKAGEHDFVAQDIRTVVEAARASRTGVKVILETGLLTPEETTRACQLASEAGADFVKTSTGFGPRGASREDVARMRAAVGPTLGVKAAGGIRTLAFALELLEAGATRLGTSASLELLRQLDD